MIKKILDKTIPLRIKKQLQNFSILAFEYAQYRTIKKWNCVDKSGNEIAWYTYPAIEYLDNIDFSGKSIFEYGSGNSSIFWARKAKNVTSVEHDKLWFEKVKVNLSNNQKLLYKENNEQYENSILDLNKKFDVIVIDGIRRPECSKVIGSCLNNDSSDGFMVVLDNSDWYRETSKYLRDELDLVQVDFHGFGPINNYTWTTSVFFSRNFKFKPVNDIQPHFSKAAIVKSGELIVY